MTQNTGAEETQAKEMNMPRRLPIIHLNGKAYFVDERLKQLRNVRNPHDFIDF